MFDPIVYFIFGFIVIWLLTFSLSFFIFKRKRKKMLEAKKLKLNSDVEELKSNHLKIINASVEKQKTNVSKYFASQNTRFNKKIKWWIWNVFINICFLFALLLSIMLENTYSNSNADIYIVGIYVFPIYFIGMIILMQFYAFNTWSPFKMNGEKRILFTGIISILFYYSYIAFPFVIYAMATMEYDEWSIFALGLAVIWFWFVFYGTLLFLFEKKEKKYLFGLLKFKNVWKIYQDSKNENINDQDNNTRTNK